MYCRARPLLRGEIGNIETINSDVEGEKSRPVVDFPGNGRGNDGEFHTELLAQGKQALTVLQV